MIVRELKNKLEMFPDHMEVRVLANYKMTLLRNIDVVRGIAREVGDKLYMSSNTDEHHIQPDERLVVVLDSGDIDGRSYNEVYGKEDTDAQRMEE